MLSILTFLCVAATVGAQSPLTVHYPLGMPLRSGTGSSLALGGCGVGVADDFFGLSNNPANLGASQRTIFSAVLSGELLLLNDAATASQHLDMNLRLFSLTVPLGRFGSIGASFSPYSSANVRFRTQEGIDIDGMLADTMELGILQSGGSHIWQIGWGYAIKRWARIGVSYMRFSSHETGIGITQMRGSLNDLLVDSLRTAFVTNGIRGGIQIPVGDLTIGVSGDYYFINTARSNRTILGTRDTMKMVSSNESQLKPPPTLTAGLSYQFTPQWLAALDIGTTMWDRYYSPTPSPTPLREKAYSVSCGARYVPAPNLLKPKLYEVIHYRAGMRYTQLPGTDANEMALTLSAGLPMQGDGGLFDIILEYGKRSDNRFDDYRENIISLKFGINGARRWYQAQTDSY